MTRTDLFALSCTLLLVALLYLALSPASARLVRRLRRAWRQWIYRPEPGRYMDDALETEIARGRLLRAEEEADHWTKGEAA